MPIPYKRNPDAAPEEVCELAAPSLAALSLEADSVLVAVVVDVAEELATAPVVVELVISALILLLREGSGAAVAGEPTALIVELLSEPVLVPVVVVLLTKLMAGKIAVEGQLVVVNEQLRTRSLTSGSFISFDQHHNE